MCIRDRSISGRKADVAYIKDNIPVTAAFFGDIFKELNYDFFKYFTRFQIYQKKKGDFICRLEQADKNVAFPESEKVLFLERLQTLGTVSYTHLILYCSLQKKGTLSSCIVLYD